MCSWEVLPGSQMSAFLHKWTWSTQLEKFLLQTAIDCDPLLGWRPSLLGWRPLLHIASRLEAIASRNKETRTGRKV